MAFRRSSATLGVLGSLWGRGKPLGGGIALMTLPSITAAQRAKIAVSKDRLWPESYLDGLLPIVRFSSFSGSLMDDSEEDGWPCKGLKTGTFGEPTLSSSGTLIALPYIVYILKSETTSKYYIGHTDNLDRRLSQHNNPDYHGTKHTKRNKGPWSCVYTEEYNSRSEAMKREKEIKAKKSSKYIEFLIGNQQQLPGIP